MEILWNVENENVMPHFTGGPLNGAGPAAGPGLGQPVLRSPAAMPLMEMWMPRLTFSS